MSQIPYRANLSAATFPLTLARAGRSVIIPGYDNNYDRRVDPAGESSKGSVGIPQAIYLQNILPTPEGYRTVKIVAAADPTIGFGGAAALTMPFAGWTTDVASSEQRPVLFCAPALNNTLQVRDTTFAGSTWASATLVGAAGIQMGPGVGLVCQGQAYLWTQSGGGSGQLFTVDNAYTVTNVTASITGLGATGLVRSICSAFNYLIYADENTVYWSSTTNPLDFVPSTITGASSEKLTNNVSFIRFILPHPAGFFVYTESNVIAALYTGNRAYPWKFVPIANSGAISNPRNVGFTPESQTHFGKTDAGAIQAISVNGAEIILPEISELLERENSFDVFTDGSNSFSRTVDPRTVDIRLCVALDKYLIISYGGVTVGGDSGPCKMALVYDITLKRLGKFVFNHSFIYSESSNYLYYVDLNYVATATDLCYQVLLDSKGSSLFQSALVLGKYCVSRGRTIGLEHLDVECADTNLPTVLLLPSNDGKTFAAAVTPTLISTIDTLQKYNAHTEARNISILLKGQFEVTTVDIRCTIGGRYE